MSFLVPDASLGVVLVHGLGDDGPLLAAVRAGDNIGHDSVGPEHGVVVDRVSCFILADGSSAFRPLRGRLDASLSGELRSTADQFDHLPQPQKCFFLREIKRSKRMAHSR